MELQYYQTASGRRPFVEWLGQLTDRQARWRIEARLAEDIKRAKDYFQAYKRRASETGGRRT